MFFRSKKCIALSISLILISALFGLAEAGFSKPSSDITLDVYYSPYQNQMPSLQRNFSILKKQFKDKLRINFYPVSVMDYTTDSSPDSKTMLEETLRQVFIAGRYPDSALDYLYARTCNISDPEWTHYACLAGFNENEINEIEAGVRDSATLQMAMSYGKAADKFGFSKGPVVLIGGQPFDAYGDLMHTAAYVNSLLPASERLDGLPRMDDYSPVEVIAVVNPYGYGGNIAPYTGLLKENFSGVTITRIDYRSKEGEKLIQECKLSFLPSFIVKKNLLQKKAARVNDRIDGLMKNGALTASPGSDYLLFSSTQIVYGLHIGRVKKENELTVFVNGCSTESIAVVVDILKTQQRTDKPYGVKLNWIYAVGLVSTNAPVSIDSFSSNRGRAEVEEDIRQLLIQKYFPDRFMTYLLARSSAPDSTLVHSALEKADIPEKMIMDKMSSEGVGLLFDNIISAREFHIIDSPVFLWENRCFMDIEGFRMMTIFPSLGKSSCKKCGG
jgi:hypothetical protein